MRLNDKIKNDNVIIKIVHGKYIKACREYEKIKYQILKEQTDILDHFRSIINKGIGQSHKCDCCGPTYYDDAWFTDDGIAMRMDADHPNDIHDADWSWDEIENYLKDNNNNETE